MQNESLDLGVHVRKGYWILTEKEIVFVRKGNLICQKRKLVVKGLADSTDRHKLWSEAGAVVKAGVTPPVPAA